MSGASSGPRGADRRVLGAVLAGGRSRRFGRDKARARLGSRTLLERAVGTLRELLDDVLVVSGDPAHEIRGATRIPDLRPGRGPLAGIEAALDRATREGREGVFVLACDLPGVTPDVVARILAAREGRGAVAPARSGAPGHEPLCAYYASACRAHAARLLDGARAAAHDLLPAAGGLVLPLRPGESFLNVNAPEDLQAAEPRPPDGPAAAGSRPAGRPDPTPVRAPGDERS